MEMERGHGDIERPAENGSRRADHGLQRAALPLHGAGAGQGDLLAVRAPRANPIFTSRHLSCRISSIICWAGGYISITLIPLLSALFEEDEEDGWRFFGAVFTWATLAILGLAVLGWLFAAPLARLVAPGFTVEQHARLAHFLRIVLPAQIFFLPGACLSALLYIRRQFAVPALMPLIYNGFILLGGMLLPALGLARGMEGFAGGYWPALSQGLFCCPVSRHEKGG